MLRVSQSLRGLVSHFGYSFSQCPSNGKPPKMAPFDPVEHGLRSDFILTNFTKMKG